MILSDRDIVKYIESKHIKVDPFDENKIQPASLDIHLDNKFRIFDTLKIPFIDLKKEYHITNLIHIEDDPLLLHPGDFVLGSTFEHISISNHLVARIEGKSSLGRLGLLVHSTAGFIDPGWSGPLTLELRNISNLPITLYYKMPVAQIAFMLLSSPSQNSYGSDKLNNKYQNQASPAESKFYLNYQ